MKPASGSFAHGVSRVEDAEQLAEALREALKDCRRALVQPWVEGVQLSVPVIGTGWNAFALPPGGDRGEGGLVRRRGATGL